MNVAYPLELHEEDGAFWAQGLTPLDGLFTEAKDRDELRLMASDALTLMLGSMLDNGEPVPRPPDGAPESKAQVVWVVPAPNIVAALLLRWSREDAKISQGELASRLNITRQAIQKLERSDANPSVKTLARVFRALGRDLHLAV